MLQNLKKNKNSPLIVIPAYNEAQSIVSLINSIAEINPEWDILIVNDASTDNTSELAEATKKAAVVNLPYNLGIGGCVQTGFKFAARYDYSFVLQVDGDGQHLAEEIPKLLDYIMSNGADVVIGSRFCEKHSGYKSTQTRRVGIRFFQVVTRLLIRQKITDCTSGFRAYNKKAIKFLASNYPMDYPEPEAVILLGRNRFIIKEVFTKMQERQGGTSSLKRKGAYFMIKVLLAMIMTSIRARVSIEGESNLTSSF